MFHSTSGKDGYGYRYVDYKIVIPKHIMKQILLREEELRMSPEYHEEISKLDDLKWIRDVTLRLQRRVLREFGYNTSTALVALNNARAMYLNDPEMNQITVYQRRDRSRKGDLFAGSTLPNVKLAALDGTHITLHEYIGKIQQENGRPLVITAGSVT